MLLLHGAPVEYAEGINIQICHSILVAFQFSKPERVIEAFKLLYEHGGSLRAPLQEGIVLYMLLL